VGLFVCLEPADRHGGRQGTALQHGHGSGQLWADLPVCLVGGHRELGRGRPPPLDQSGVDGPAPFEAMGTVPH
jgi:hypothetical protein